MVTFDMQNILQIPTSEVGPLYYKRKLVLHNLNIYEDDKSAFCYLWTEVDGKRGANEIGSCILTYLRQLDPKIRHITFFSDSCSGQNRNQYLCALLLYAVNKLPIDVIDHKFLVPRHTMMECDSMHSAIEHAQRLLAVYSVHEWVNIIKSARRHNPYSVEVLDYKRFYNLKVLASKILANRRKLTTGALVNWLQVRWIRVENSTPDRVLFKTDFDQLEFDVLMQVNKSREAALGRSSIQLTSAYTKKLPISGPKYGDLMLMLKSGIIPDIYAHFFKSLPVGKQLTIDYVPESSDEDDE